MNLFINNNNNNNSLSYENIILFAMFLYGFNVIYER